MLKQKREEFKKALDANDEKKALSIFAKEGLTVMRTSYLKHIKEHMPNLYRMLGIDDVESSPEKASVVNEVPVVVEEVSVVVENKVPVNDKEEKEVPINDKEEKAPINDEKEEVSVAREEFKTSINTTLIGHFNWKRLPINSELVPHRFSEFTYNLPYFLKDKCYRAVAMAMKGRVLQKLRSEWMDQQDALREMIHNKHRRDMGEQVDFVAFANEEKKAALNSLHWLESLQRSMNFRLPPIVIFYNGIDCAWVFLEQKEDVVIIGGSFFFKLDENNKTLVDDFVLLFVTDEPEDGKQILHLYPAEKQLESLHKKEDAVYHMRLKCSGENNKGLALGNIKVKYTGYDRQQHRVFSIQSVELKQDGTDNTGYDIDFPASNYH